jgi:hypothetical protein
MQIENKPGYTPPPDGMSNAVCVDVIDVGLVEEEYKGEKKIARKCRLVFELEARRTDGKPFMVSKTFTASLHEKASLLKFLKEWSVPLAGNGATFDLGELVGKNIGLLLRHERDKEGRTFARITAPSKPVKRIQPSGSYNHLLECERIKKFMGADLLPVSTAAGKASKGAPPSMPAPIAQQTAPAPAALLIDDDIPF